MKILTHEDKAYPAFVKKLYRLAIPSDAVSDTVAEIVAEVAKKEIVLWSLLRRSLMGRDSPQSR